MTQEEKQLLLKDLCARIPYHTLVQLNPGAYNKPETCLLTGVHGEKVHLNVDSDPFKINSIKPYLRPLSNMTKEEEKELKSTLPFGISFSWDVNNEFIIYTDSEYDGDHYFSCFVDIQDWLNAHHFDFRGLIEKGLAIDCTNLNIYKENKRL